MRRTEFRQNVLECYTIFLFRFAFPVDIGILDGAKGAHYIRNESYWRHLFLT